MIDGVFGSGGAPARGAAAASGRSDGDRPAADDRHAAGHPPVPAVASIDCCRDDGAIDDRAHAHLVQKTPNLGNGPDLRQKLLFSMAILYGGNTSSRGGKRV